MKSISILDVLTFPEKQKFAFLLTQLEAAGISGLSEGRQVVEEHVRIKHNLLQRKLSKNIRDGIPNKTVTEVSKCPDCGRGLIPKLLDNETWKKPNRSTTSTIKVLWCPCGWSKSLEKE